MLEAFDVAVEVDEVGGAGVAEVDVALVAGEAVAGALAFVEEDGFAGVADVEGFADEVLVDGVVGLAVLGALGAEEDGVVGPELLGGMGPVL